MSTKKQNLEVTVLLQAAQITRLSNQISELEAKLRENSLRTKQSRAQELESEESFIGKQNVRQEQFASVVSNYRQALTRNDQLLEEIEMVRKSSIFIEAESKALKKKLVELEATITKLKKQLAEHGMREQQTEQRANQLSHKQKQTQRQHIKIAEQQHHKTKKLKQDVVEVYTQFSIYRQMYRVLKSVVCTQFNGLKSQEVDKLAQSLLGKYGNAEQLNMVVLEGLETQQIAVLTRDVRRTFEMFFIEVTTLREAGEFTLRKNEYGNGGLTERIERGNGKTRREDNNDAELLELKMKYRKLQQANFELTMNKDSHKQEHERYKAEIKTLNNEIDKLRSQNRALNAAISVEQNAAQRIYYLDSQLQMQKQKTNQRTSSLQKQQKMALHKQNNDLRQNIRQLTKANNNLYQQLRTAALNGNQARREPPSPRSQPSSSSQSRIRKNNLNNSEDLQVSGDYFLVRHLQKLALKDKYQQLQKQYQKTLDNFTKLLQSRHRKIQQLQDIIRELLGTNFSKS